MYFNFKMVLDEKTEVVVESECNNGFDVDYVSVFIGEQEVYGELSEKNQGMIMEEVFRQISERRYTTIEQGRQ
jgi:hypothetical protein